MTGILPIGFANKISLRSYEAGGRGPLTPIMNRCNVSKGKSLDMGYWECTIHAMCTIGMLWVSSNARQVVELNGCTSAEIML